MDKEQKQLGIGLGIAIFLWWLFGKKPVEVVEDTGGGGGGGGPIGRGTQIPPKMPNQIIGTPVYNSINPPPAAVFTCPPGQLKCPTKNVCYDPNAANVFVGTINGIYGEYKIDPCNPPAGYP